VFTFCCYRALLLGSPAVVLQATLQPGGKKILADPLSPQLLLGEETVEPREWSNRLALQFRLQRQGGGGTNRYLFGCRRSDVKGSPGGLRYQPNEALLDRTTGRPPAFADAEDFRRQVPVLVRGRPPTKAQVWNTWFWLLLHQTFHGAKVAGQFTLVPWYRDQHGIYVRGLTLVKKGR
jgi:hypothetical protein